MGIFSLYHSWQVFHSFLFSSLNAMNGYPFLETAKGRFPRQSVTVVHYHYHWKLIYFLIKTPFLCLLSIFVIFFCHWKCYRVPPFWPPFLYSKNPDSNDHDRSWGRNLIFQSKPNISRYIKWIWEANFIRFWNEIGIHCSFQPWMTDRSPHKISLLLWPSVGFLVQWWENIVN